MITIASTESTSHPKASASRLAVIIGLPLLICTSIARAAGTPVLDGGPPNHTLRFNADVSYTFTTAATEINLANAVQFNQFDWWGAYANGGKATATDGFELIIYSAANNTPIAPIFVESLGNGNATLTGIAYPSGALEYAYSALFPTLTLNAGQYFLGITRGGGNGTDVWGWGQTSGGPQLGGGSFNQLGQFTASATENLAYQAFLTAAVPEPSSYVLMLSGMAVVALSVRRRRFA